MKVLYCILDNRFGGPHRLAHSVSLRLREQGIETVFLTGRKTDDVWQPDDATAFHLRHIQCYRRRRPITNLLLFCLFLPCNVWRVAHIIRSNAIDIVHIDGVTNFVPALAAWFTRRPIVWLYNDHLPATVHRLLLPIVGRLSAAVIVQGDKLKDQRTRGMAQLQAKTTVLHSCVDPTEFDPAAYDDERKMQIKRDLGIPADCAVVGMIGNLNPLKGHTYFIQAAARVKKEVGSVKFLIVGRRLDTAPGYWEQLQDLTGEGELENDIIYAGFQSDIPSMIAVMDVFVLASVLESCPVVVLEAMAMEAPVVATAVGAVSELLDDGRAGIVVPVADAGAIAKAVIDCLSGPSARVKAMTETARKRVEEVFAVERIAGRQKDLYDAVHRPRTARR